MADRIVIMQDGLVVQSGTPDDVYFRSANAFVAGFIGTPPTNFFNVIVQRDGGVLHLKYPAFDLALDNDKRLGNYTKNTLILGVRPEDLIITKEENACFSKQVLVVEPQGSYQIVAIEIEGEIAKIVTPSDRRISPGELLHLDFRQNALHFFDSETEQKVEMQ